MELANHSNSKPSFEQISRIFHPLFLKLASQFHVEIDDIKQEAFLVYIEDSTFNPELGSYPPRFCYKLQKHLLQVHKKNHLHTELPENFEETVASVELDNIQNWRVDNEFDGKHLGGEIGKIVQLLLDGLDFKQVAMELGLTRRRIYQIAATATQKNSTQDLFLGA